MIWDEDCSDFFENMQDDIFLSHGFLIRFGGIRSLFFRKVKSKPCVYESYEKKIFQQNPHYRLWLSFTMHPTPFIGQTRCSAKKHYNN